MIVVSIILYLILIFVLFALLSFIGIPAFMILFLYLAYSYGLFYMCLTNIVYMNPKAYVNYDLDKMKYILSNLYKHIFEVRLDFSWLSGKNSLGKLAYII